MNPSATWMLVRRHRAVVIRSLLLSAVVFTVATLAGALLATAAAWPSVDPSDPAAVSAAPPPEELVFARSMVYSGTAALALSLTGIAIVGRRRRLW